jgi:hypothetical protein
MTGEQDCSDATAAPALLLWSRLVQGAAAVVIVLSLTLLLSPHLGEAIFNLVYFHQFSMPVEVPSLAHGYIWFANGIIGAVMAGWMICRRAGWRARAPKFGEPDVPTGPYPPIAIFHARGLLR